MVETPRSPLQLAVLQPGPRCPDVPVLCCSHHCACGEGRKELAVPGGLPGDSHQHLHPGGAGGQVQALPQELRQLPPPATARDQLDWRQPHGGGPGLGQGLLRLG